MGRRTRRPLFGAELLVLVVVVVLLAAPGRAGPLGPPGRPGPPPNDLGVTLELRPDSTPVPAPTWIGLHANATTPPPRVAPAMAFDPADNETILFSGHLAGSSGDYPDTWALHGTTWTNLTPTLNRSPPARSGSSLAWDPSEGALVLFGGLNSSQSQFVNDTWTFVHGAWTPVPTVVAPSPRNWAAMTTDSTDGNVVLFGGIGGGPVDNDTWTFGGGRWSRATPAANPGPLTYASAADDPSENGVVVFGGTSSGSFLNPLNTTWLYARGDWARLTGPTPSARTTPELVGDAAAGAVVLFGGYNGTTGSYENDTWQLRNSSWSPLPAPGAPSPRGGGGASYDATVQRVDVFCGAGTSADLGDGGTLDWLSVHLGPSVRMGPGPLPVQFSPVVTGGFPPYAFRWTFGDGFASNQSDPSHIFDEPESYVVNATVVDADGVESNGSVVIDVIVLPLSAELTAAPTFGGAPLRVTFTEVPSGGLSPFNATWSFGDGTVGSGLQVRHTYSAAGTFTANVTLRDARGNVTRNSTVVRALEDRGPLNASISASPRSGAPPLSVEFRAVVAGGTGNLTLRWEFGDGGTATGTFVNHTYPSVGLWTANLTVEDAVGNTTTAETTIDVSAVTPTHPHGTSPPNGGFALGPLSGRSLELAVGIGAAAIAAVAIGALLVRRRRRSPPSETS